MPPLPLIGASSASESGYLHRTLTSRKPRRTQASNTCRRLAMEAVSANHAGATSRANIRSGSIERPPWRIRSMRTSPSRRRTRNPSASGSIGHTCKEADQGEQDEEEEEAAEEEVEEVEVQKWRSKQLLSHQSNSGPSGPHAIQGASLTTNQWRSKRWWRRRSSRLTGSPCGPW